MLAYLVRRLLLMVVTLFLVATAVFVLLRVVPGDTVSLMLQDQGYRPEEVQRLRNELGLDKSISKQYSIYLRDVGQGDLGRSLWSNKSVAGELLRSKLPVTLELSALALCISLLIAVPAGVLSARHSNTGIDYGLRAASMLGLSVPGFWLATLVIVLPAIWWGYAPPFRLISITDDPVGNAKQFIVPAIVMGASLAAILYRLVRGEVMEVLASDYMRTARAKGLGEFRVLFVHGLRNALIPIITMAGLQFSAALGGTIVFESVFNLPGIGTYAFEGLNRRDYPVIQGVILLVSIMVLVVNLTVDLSYAVLDPRVKYGRR